AKPSSEPSLVRRREMLLPKQQDAVLVPSFKDCLKLHILERRAQIHTDDFGTDCRREGDRGYGLSRDVGRRFLRKVRFHLIRLRCVLTANWQRGVDASARLSCQQQANLRGRAPMLISTSRSSFSNPDCRGGAWRSEPRR